MPTAPKPGGRLVSCIAPVIKAATSRRGVLVLVVCAFLFLVSRSPLTRLLAVRWSSKQPPALPPAAGQQDGEEFYRAYGPIDGDGSTVALLSWSPERPVVDERRLVDELPARSAADPGVAATLDPPAWASSLLGAEASTSVHADFPYALNAAARDAVAQSPAASSALTAELNRRVTIGLGMGIHSGNLRVWLWGVDILPVLATLLPSFLPTAQPNHIYRFYLAFDAVDPIFSDAGVRQRVEAAAQALFAAEDARRWHPDGYVPGRTVDGSTLLMSMHWVRCDYAGKPAWAHSDAIMAAFREGADYAFRTNDDTAFPPQPDWADRFIADLRSRSPVANLGVVGPSCGRGNTDILTHDFVHRTHAAIFNFHYPRSLPGECA